jgi:hypothetical protein
MPRRPCRCPIVALSVAVDLSAHDEAMTDTTSDRMHLTIHLVQQTTVEFDAVQLWPMHGTYSRFGADLASFAEEVMRRLGTDGYLGFRPDEATISLIPLNAVKRIDFVVRA